MDSLVRFIKKHFKLSRSWLKAWFALVLVSIVANHLAQPENFPFNSSYQFPVYQVLLSILLISIFTVIGELNFQYFKKKHFSESIDTPILLRFLLSTLGYDAIVYVVLFYIVNGVEALNLYELLVGFFVTMLLCTLGTIFFYAKAVHKLQRFISVKGKLKVNYNGKITLISYEDIAFAYSQNKIACLVKTDGTLVRTDFTLNEIEERIKTEDFYRANRQTILHPSSIEQIMPIENGKLSVLLKTALLGKEMTPLTISRYKRQEFLSWFEDRS